MNSVTRKDFTRVPWRHLSRKWYASKDVSAVIGCHGLSSVIMLVIYDS